MPFTEFPIPSAELSTVAADARTAIDAMQNTNAAVNTAIADDAGATRNAAGVSPSTDNAPPLFTIESPYGNTYSAHLGIIDVPDRISGWRYIMAHTPVYDTGSGPHVYENPCVAVSNDKINWQLPPGLTTPLATYAEATGLGLYSWSDTDIAISGGTVYVFWRGANSLGANDCIYYRTSTDLVNWTPKVAVFTGQPHSSLLSPSIVQEADGTWSMYCVNSPLGKIQRRTSATLDGTWSAATDCTLPPRQTAWHLTVKRSGGAYYMLLCSTGTSYNNTFRNTMLYSTDGVTWQGREKLFLPVSGLDFDKGGHYRSTFLPKAGWPAKFDVWAVSFEAVSNTWFNAYCERTFDDSILYNRKITEGSKELRIEDWFFGPSGSIGDAASVGQLGWITHNTGANGTVTGGSYDNNSYGVNSLAIATASGASGRATACVLQKNGQGMTRENFTKTINPVWSWWFNTRTSATGDAFYLGFGPSVSFNGTPTVFAGLRGIRGTDTNFKFLLANNTVIDAATTDLGVAMDTNWHRFQMSWDAATSSWLARMDNNPWTVIPNTGSLGGSPVAIALPTTAAGYLNMNVVSGSTATAWMRVQYFCWDFAINHF